MASWKQGVGLALLFGIGSMMLAVEFGAFSRFGIRPDHGFSLCELIWVVVALLLLVNGILLTCEMLTTSKPRGFPVEPDKNDSLDQDN